MKIIHQLFLEALKASLQKRSVSWSFDISDLQWQQIFKMAYAHHILPMIYDAVYNCPAICRMDPEMLAIYKSETKKAVTVQAIKTEEFLRILCYLEDFGLHPLTVKGLICRNLYPQPDYRDSGDEDLLVPPDEFEACQKALCAMGLQKISRIRKGPSENARDIAYGRQGHPVYVELHPSLFPPDAEIYGDWNIFFRDIYDHAIKINICGQAIRTMNASDHLFYLICHALKHFYHSGFGIRQICDILLFAGHYGPMINWQQIFDQCRQLHSLCFAAAIFQIGIDYLDFDPESAGYPHQWKQLSVNETPLLADLLAAGLYGGAPAGRKHSSRITLHAIQQTPSQSTWQRLSRGWIPVFFPTFQEMERQYPWLHSKPWLLPAAWYQRWQHYFSEQKLSLQISAGLSAIKTGVHRTRLMQYYRLIPEKHKKAGGLLDEDIYKFNEKKTGGNLFRDF